VAIAPSFNDVVDIGVTSLGTDRPDLAVRDGDITEAMIHVSAVMSDAVTRYASQAVLETWLDGAKGDALTKLVDDHWNIQRFPSVAAQVDLEFSRPSAGAGAGTILTGTVVATEPAADGSFSEFQTISDVNFGAADLGPLTVSAVATETGSDGNVAAGAVTRITTALFDPTIAVVNPNTAAGGADEERDDELRVRARGFWLTLRRGTVDALIYGARQVPTVRVAAVVEVDGIVFVFVSDGDGNSTLQMVSDVETELENWRAAGVTVVVIGSEPVVVDVAVAVRIPDSIDVSVLSPIVEDALRNRLRRMTGGEVLYEAIVCGAIIGVAPNSITELMFSDPPSFPIVPLAHEVVRLGTFTMTRI
jgi:hypothetical protein